MMSKDQITTGLDPSGSATLTTRATFPAMSITVFLDRGEVMKLGAELTELAAAMDRAKRKKRDELERPHAALFKAAYECADDCDTCWFLCSDQEDIPVEQVIARLRAHLDSGHTTTSEE